MRRVHNAFVDRWIERNFLAIPIHAIPRADPLLHSRGEPWKLIILSAAFRQRTNPESTGERPRERTRRHHRVAPRRAASSFISNDLSLEILNSSFTEASLSLRVLIFAYRLSPGAGVTRESKNLPIITVHQNRCASITNVLLTLTFFKLKSSFSLYTTIQFGTRNNTSNAIWTDQRIGFENFESYKMKLKKKIFFGVYSSIKKLALMKMLQIPPVL